jgi:AhpD family alkylhydroperoxidase
MDQGASNHVGRYDHLRMSLRRLSTELPGPMAGFARLHHDALADGALSRVTKELMALAIGICTPCDGCVTFHVHDALLAGATREQVLETIGVAVMMGGGPATVYGTLALEALDDLLAASDHPAGASPTGGAG